MKWIAAKLGRLQQKLTGLRRPTMPESYEVARAEYERTGQFAADVPEDVREYVKDAVEAGRRYDEEVLAAGCELDKLHQKHPDDTTVLLHRGAECFIVQPDAVDAYLARGYIRERDGIWCVKPGGGWESRKSPNDLWPSEAGATERKDHP